MAAIETTPTGRSEVEAKIEASLSLPPSPASEMSCKPATVVGRDLPTLSNQSGIARQEFLSSSHFNLREVFAAIVKLNGLKSSTNVMFHSKRPPDMSRPVGQGPMKTEKDVAEVIGSHSRLNWLENGGSVETAWTPGRQEWTVMIVLALASLPVALDSTILVTVLPHLAVTLDGTAAQSFWVGTSYLLASAVVQPLIVTLSDVFGRRELLLPSITGFLIGSLICAVSRNFSVLLAGRVVQGVGGGGIIALSQVIYGDVVPLRQRPKYFGLVLGAWAIGTMLGPVIGGVFVQTVTWRWCFYLNLPLGGITLPLAVYGVHLHAERKQICEKLELIDWTGVFLLTFSLTVFLVGISFGGVTFAWNSWQTLLPLAGGVVGIAATIEFERRYASRPVLSRSLFNSASANLSYATAFFQGLILCMALYYISFYFSAVQLHSPIMAGVHIFPATFLLIPSSLVTSVLITRWGSYRAPIWGGWVITCAGCGLLISWDENTGVAMSAVALCVLGTGLGMVLTSVNVAVQASVTTSSDSGSAGAMYAFIRTTGMTVGVAIGGTIFQNLMKMHLARHGVDVDIAANAEAFVEDTLQHLPDDSSLLAVVRDGYVIGFRGVFIAMAILSTAALVVSAPIKHRSMDRLLQSRFSLVRQVSANRD